MKERIQPWGEKREEFMREIPLRHLEQGVMGMHEILALYPEVRTKIDTEFKNRMDTQVVLATKGCESGSDEWCKRCDDACAEFLTPLADCAETPDEHRRVDELVDELVSRWQSLACNVKVDEIDLFAPSFDFIHELLSSDEVRQKLLSVGCVALNTVYEALACPFVDAAVSSEESEFYCNEDSQDAQDKIFRVAQKRALKAYYYDPEEFIANISFLSPDILYDQFDDYHKSVSGVGGYVQNLLNHVKHEAEVDFGCKCQACLYLPSDDLVSLFRALGSYIFAKNFGSSDAERELIVAMFKQHVRSQNYKQLRDRALNLTKQVPIESSHVGQVMHSWFDTLLNRGGLTSDEAAGLKDRVGNALAYVGKHAVVVNADPMESGLGCIGGDYDATTHVIRVRYVEDHEVMGYGEGVVFGDDNYEDEDEDEDGEEYDHDGYAGDEHIAFHHSDSRNTVGHSVDVIRHELIHAVSGHGLLNDGSGRDVDSMQVGFHKYDRFVWLNEAFTEFFARYTAIYYRGMVESEHDALTESFSYDDERQLLRELLDHPDINWDRAMGRLTMAFFEDVGTGTPVKYFHEMNRMLSEVYGEGFLVNLDEYILRVTHAKQKEDHTITWGYGVEVALKEWRKSYEKFRDYRFAKTYIVGEEYKKDYDKIPRNQKEVSS